MPRKNQPSSPALLKIDGYPGVYAFGDTPRDARSERRFLKKVERNARKLSESRLATGGSF
jgi:hypothetical protein